LGKEVPSRSERKINVSTKKMVPNKLRKIVSQKKKNVRRSPRVCDKITFSHMPSEPPNGL
jgi:hypothetical protein